MANNLASGNIGVEKSTLSLTLYNTALLYNTLNELIVNDTEVTEILARIKKHCNQLEDDIKNMNTKSEENENENEVIRQNSRSLPFNAIRPNIRRASNKNLVQPKNPISSPSSASAYGTTTSISISPSPKQLQRTVSHTTPSSVTHSNTPIHHQQKHISPLIHLIVKRYKECQLVVSHTPIITSNVYKGLHTIQSHLQQLFTLNDENHSLDMNMNNSNHPTNHHKTTTCIHQLMGSFVALDDYDTPMNHTETQRHLKNEHDDNGFMSKTHELDDVKAYDGKTNYHVDSQVNIEHTAEGTNSHRQQYTCMLYGILILLCQQTLSLLKITNHDIHHNLSSTTPSINHSIKHSSVTSTSSSDTVKALLHTIKQLTAILQALTHLPITYSFIVLLRYLVLHTIVQCITSIHTTVVQQSIDLLYKIYQSYGVYLITEFTTIFNETFLPMLQSALTIPLAYRSIHHLSIELSILQFMNQLFTDDRSRSTVLLEFYMNYQIQRTHKNHRTLQQLIKVCSQLIVYYTTQLASSSSSSSPSFTGIQLSDYTQPNLSWLHTSTPSNVATLMKDIMTTTAVGITHLTNHPHTTTTTVSSSATSYDHSERPQQLYRLIKESQYSLMKLIGQISLLSMKSCLSLYDAQYPQNQDSAHRISSGSSTINTSEWYIRYKELLHQEDMESQAIEIFNTYGYKQMIQYFQTKNPVTSYNPTDHSLVNYTSPSSLATFLYSSMKSLNPQEIGEFLSNSDDKYFTATQYITLRYTYVRHMCFRGESFEYSLRMYLTSAGFRLPGEAQRIDRLLDVFCQIYVLDNPTVFDTHHTAFIVAFALVMLNTDLHDTRLQESGSGGIGGGSSSRQSMTCQQFIRNLRGVGKNPLDERYLTTMYYAIKNQEIQWKDPPNSQNGRNQNDQVDAMNHTANEESSSTGDESQGDMKEENPTGNKVQSRENDRKLQEYYQQQDQSVKTIVFRTLSRFHKTQYQHRTMVHLPPMMIESKELDHSHLSTLQHLLTVLSNELHKPIYHLLQKLFSNTITSSDIYLIDVDLLMTMIQSHIYLGTPLHEYHLYLLLLCKLTLQYQMTDMNEPIPNRLPSKEELNTTSTVAPDSHQQGAGGSTRAVPSTTTNNNSNSNRLLDRINQQIARNQHLKQEWYLEVMSLISNNNNTKHPSNTSVTRIIDLIQQQGIKLKEYIGDEKNCLKLKELQASFGQEIKLVTRSFLSSPPPSSLPLNATHPPPPTRTHHRRELLGESMIQRLILEKQSMKSWSPVYVFAFTDYLLLATDGIHTTYKLIKSLPLSHCRVIDIQFNHAPSYKHPYITYGWQLMTPNNKVYTFNCSTLSEKQYWLTLLKKWITRCIVVDQARRLETTAVGVSDSQDPTICTLCLRSYTMFRRRHACDLCKKSICSECRTSKIPSASSNITPTPTLNHTSANPSTSTSSSSKSSLSHDNSTPTFLKICDTCSMKRSVYEQMPAVTAVMHSPTVCKHPCEICDMK